MNAGGHVNAHTHLYSGLAPLGLPRLCPAPRGLLEILQRIWWRLDRALDAEALRAAADLYVAEALLAGTTVLFDHHESPNFIAGSLDVLADSCQDLGMHAVLCYGATERNGGRAEARLGLAECWRFMESNCRPLVEGVVGLHAAFTVSDETLREAGAIAREYGTVVHLHVAEDRCDVLDAQQRGYSGVIDRLLKTRALPCGSILAHGVHLTADEVRTCAAEGFWLVQNPRSNAKNGVGYAASLRESERVALGTDGFPADMLAEQEALRGEAAQHGDDPERAARRLDAGRLLAAELLPRVEAARAADLSARRLAEIRARAEAAALRLWRRMEEIGEP